MPLTSSEEYFSYIDNNNKTWWSTCPLRVFKDRIFGSVKLKT